MITLPYDWFLVSFVTIEHILLNSTSWWRESPWLPAVVITPSIPFYVYYPFTFHHDFNQNREMDSSEIAALSQCICVLCDERSSSEEKDRANGVLSRFSDSEEGWFLALQILQSNDLSMRYFNCIKNRHFLQRSFLCAQSSNICISQKLEVHTERYTKVHSWLFGWFAKEPDSGLFLVLIFQCRWCMPRIRCYLRSSLTWSRRQWRLAGQVNGRVAWNRWRTMWRCFPGMSGRQEGIRSRCFWRLRFCATFAWILAQARRNTTASTAGGSAWRVSFRLLRRLCGTVFSSFSQTRQRKRSTPATLCSPPSSASSHPSSNAFPFRFLPIP